MRFLKIVFGIVGFLAAYQAYQILIVGRPVDPQKALAEWAQKTNAELPKEISPTAMLTGASFRWHERTSIWFGEELKDWNETYELRVEPDQEILSEEKQKLISHICQSELHQKILALGMSIHARMIVPGTYHFKDTTITKASCIGKRQSAPLISNVKR